MVTVTAVLLAALAGWLAYGPSFAEARLARLHESAQPPRRTPKQRAAEYASTCWRRVRRARAEQATREAVVDLCTALAAELRAGRTPGEALHLAVTVLAPQQRAALSSLATTASHGGDVGEVMRNAAARPGCRSLAWLAACWQVSAESGAGLAEAVERLSRALRDEERCRKEINAQLAAPRATARLLAFLPVVGIAFATGLGQRPLAFLFGTPYGLLCLGLGVAIDIGGLIWTTRLARSAEST